LAAKVAEEVGELQVKVLGQAGDQRWSKASFTADTMASELADVPICTATLAGQLPRR
jgi:NTP pyrophosphatase (non-canonical NTP hydrolase)